jgi:hypothetical protein
MPGTTEVATTSGPLIIAINGDATSAISVGDTYSDLGATIRISSWAANYRPYKIEDGVPRSVSAAVSILKIGQ